MKKLFRSFGFAWKGLKTAVSTEVNMKIHLTVAILVVAAGFLFRISNFEWIAVILCIGLVFSAEIFNTSIETLVDKVSPNIDPLAGRTKDIAAGAVLVAAVISVVVGLLIFLPKIISLFHG